MPQQIIDGQLFDTFLVRGEGQEGKIPVVFTDQVEIKNDQGSPIPVVTGLEIPEHDYISLTYTGSSLTGVVYKTGGSGGTTVATLTLAYDGSDNLTSVTKS